MTGFCAFMILGKNFHVYIIVFILQMKEAVMSVYVVVYTCMYL